MTNDDLATVLEEVAKCFTAPHNTNARSRLRERAKALRPCQPVSNTDELRPSPSSPEGGLVLFTVSGEAPLHRWERIPEAEAVIEAARHYANCLPEEITNALLDLRRKVSALDNRRAG